MSYRVKDYMNTNVVTIDVGASALAVSKLMAEKNMGYIIAMEKNKPTGIVTEKDLIMKVVSKEKDPSAVKVSEIMSTPLITTNLEATVDNAVNTMAKYKIRRLPVVRDNVIYGIFTTRDLTRNFSKYEDRVTKDLIDAQALYGATLELGF